MLHRFEPWCVTCVSQHRDSTPEPYPPNTTSTTTLLQPTTAVPRPKKARSKAKKTPTPKPPTTVTQETEELGSRPEDDFIITSKSKAHKNIKVDPKEAFGGNIHEPK